MAQWNVPVPALTILILLGEFQAWFQTDADCLDYLEWLRWPVRLCLPCCGLAGRMAAWATADSCVRDAEAAHP